MGADMSFRRSLPTIATLTALGAATLAVAPAAQAKIVVGQSIAGMAPGMTLKQLKKAAGKPTRVNRSGGRIVTVDWDRRKLYAAFNFSTPTARTVSTQSRKQKTAEGIHAGSTAAAVRQAYPTADCDARTCFLFVDGGISTGFNFTKGRVDSIALVGP
jgi:hypothetical protein